MAIKLGNKRPLESNKNKRTGDNCGIWPEADLQYELKPGEESVITARAI